MEEFDGSRLPLPAAYDRVDTETSTAEIPLEWSQLLAGAPTDNNCPSRGEAVLWYWSHQPNAAGVGDPDVRVYLCDAGDTEYAAEIFAATPLERTVFFELTTVPDPVDLDGLELAADERKMACVLRTAELDQCRAWSYLARYGQLLVTLTFESTVQGSNLDEGSFVQVADELDALVSEIVGGP